MTLDPDTAAILDKVAALNLPTFEQVGWERARAGFERQPRAGLDVEVASVEDRTIPGPDGNEIAVRIYQPINAGSGGALVYFHGGGWVVGSLDSHDDICRALTELGGCTTISVDYRMGPEHMFPAAPEDCYAALQWVTDNNGELGIDSSKIAIAGDSAGGNLAAAVAVMARDRGGPDLALQVPIYPATNFDSNTRSMTANGEGYGLTRDAMVWFYDHYCAPEDRKHPYAAPINADLEGVAQAFIIVAGYDPLRDEGVAFAQKLQDAGVRTTLVEYPGQNHGFFGMTKYIAQSNEAQQLVGQALQRAFA